ncbi:DUF823 domain-containing adhesin [Yersinia sp. Marseille-Q3913]|uniref:adhesion domain-containing protein n=1 Tax=Yersinia sp. Marseille-Q3913 TaxID=2830769 RepID=UPI001BAEA8DD|nr:DUF823 domain-containing adhesin [Yersinia sp. Marseille-Q3913]MBS0053865.1 hypothetical protein [Yersinia sp. Marseille-Q3913]
MMKSLSTPSAPYPSFLVTPLTLLVSLMFGSLFPVIATAADPAPVISKLFLRGDLDVGESLKGDYRFSANGGNTVDKSTFSWGYKGETAQRVANGTMIGSTGYVTPRLLVSADIGHVMELSVQAKNGLNIIGNTLTLASDSEDTRNSTEEGDGEGRVGDPFSPLVSNLALTGVLDVNQILQASYNFSAGQGGSGDKSTFAWGQKGSTATQAPQGQTVTTSGKPTGYTIVKADAGKVLEISVRAKNSQNKIGNIQTLATDASAEEGNKTTGGNGQGGVTNPDGGPVISKLTLAGKLEVGQSLTAGYTFENIGGNTTDSSNYAWGIKGSTAAAVPSGQHVTTSGQVPARPLVTADVGTVMEVSVQARDGLDKTGNTLTLAADASAAEGNNSTGGNNGAVTNGSGSGTVATLVPSVSRTTAKVTETITLTVTAKDASGNTAVGASISLTSVSATNRKGAAQTPTLLINGQSSFTGTTNPLTVTLTDPNGKGVATTLNIVSDRATSSQKVTFTVPTSPDTSGANFWGHMLDSVTYSRAIFYRPQLYTENNRYNSITADNEQWSAVSNTTDGNASCNARSGGGTNFRLVLPQGTRSAGLVTLQDFAGTSVLRSSGFPTSKSYLGWDITSVDLSSGSISPASGTTIYLCQDDAYLKG